VTGKLQDLDFAIEKIEQALTMTPQLTKEMLWRSKSLAEQLIQRFDWTGETAFLKRFDQLLDVGDLDKAIQKLRDSRRTSSDLVDRVWRCTMQFGR